MVYGTLFTLLVALVRGVPFDFDFSPSYLISLFYLALFASVFGFGSYLTLPAALVPIAPPMSASCSRSCRLACPPCSKAIIGPERDLAGVACSSSSAISLC